MKTASHSIIRSLASSPFIYLLYLLDEHIRRAKASSVYETSDICIPCRHTLLPSLAPALLHLRIENLFSDLITKLFQRCYA